MNTVIFRSNKLKAQPFGSRVESGTGLQGEVIKRHNKDKMVPNTLYIFTTGYGVELRYIKNNWRPALVHINKNQTVNVGGEHVDEQDFLDLVGFWQAWKSFIIANML